MSMIQIGITAVIGAVLAVQMRSSGKAEYGTYVCVATGLLLFSFIVEYVGYFADAAGQIVSFLRLDAGYLSTMLKMIGITYIAEFTAGICRDAGCQTLAGQVEIFGKLTILLLGLPVLLALLPLPEALSLWNGRFFTARPLSLGTLDPAFSLPPAVLLAQCALLLAGLLLPLLRQRLRREGKPLA